MAKRKAAAGTRKATKSTYKPSTGKQMADAHNKHLKAGSKKR